MQSKMLQSPYIQVIQLSSPESSIPHGYSLRNVSVYLLPAPCVFPYTSPCMPPSYTSCTEISVIIEEIPTVVIHTFSCDSSHTHPPTFQPVYSSPRQEHTLVPVLIIVSSPVPWCGGPRHHAADIKVLPLMTTATKAG